MQTWEYRTVVAPNWTLKQLLEEVPPGDMPGKLVELDWRRETDIGVELYNLGSDGWELSAAAPVEALGDEPSPELLLIFKRPKEQDFGAATEAVRARLLASIEREAGAEESESL